MKRGRFWGLGTIASVTTLLLASGSSLAKSQIELSTNTPLSEVVPFKQPITLSVETSVSDQMLESSQMSVKLLTPARTPWLTTDFPVVEGTTLLEATVATVENKVQLQFMPPIRGQYQLEIANKSSVSKGSAPLPETLNFRVPENPVKYKNLLILLSILGVAGFFGGWVIGGDHTIEEGEIAPQPVRLLLSVAALVAIGTLIYMATTAETAHSHTSPRTVETEKSSQAELQPHPASLKVSLEDMAIAQVGQAIPLEVKINDAATKQPLKDVDLGISTTLLEYDKTVMAFQATPDDKGYYTWKQQFFDGSPHIITVQVSPQPDSVIQFEPFELTKRIEVEGVAPPMSVRLISLSYFTAFLVAGVGAGFWTRRRHHAQGLNS